MQKPKPTKQLRVHKPRRVSERKGLETELEYYIRLILSFRDGGKCIEADIDGARCGGGMQWGHYTDRHQSKWLIYTLATFTQCASHNYLHFHGSQTMSAAVLRLLGQGWLEEHEAVRASHSDGKVSVIDLQERLDRYKWLWETRPSLYDTEVLKYRGYYEHGIIGTN